MHRVNIPEHIVARTLKRQGRWSIHDDVSARQTAVIVVDIQNGFMASDQPVEAPAARDNVPNVGPFAAALRGASYHMTGVPAARSKPRTTRVRT